ncbi:SRPBCC family protein [Nocardia sp. NPDC051756]|uniref:SRPBCC family protein n=1 Tax=Nocardia sp. NPDC051756 TaxID=3154751 RepID=UPI0034465DD8
MPGVASYCGASSRKNPKLVRLRTARVIERPAAQVFEYIADYRRLTEWVFGITGVRAVSALDYGLSAVYEGSVDLGPKTLSSTARICGWEQDRLIALESLAGFEFTATLRMRDESATRTAIELDLVYGTSGGIAARAIARGLEPLLAMAARHTTEKLCSSCAKAIAPNGNQKGAG